MYSSQTIITNMCQNKPDPVKSKQCDTAQICDTVYCFSIFWRHLVAISLYRQVVCNTIIQGK